MNDFALFLLMAGPPADGAAPNPIITFLPFIAIIAIFYFLIIRPQSKQRKETQKMLSALKKGDKIVTAGGIHGTIQSVDEHYVVVKVADNVKIKFNRASISSMVSPGRDTEDKSDEKEDKEEEKEAAES